VCKLPKRAEATPRFRLSAVQKVRGVAPALFARTRQLSCRIPVAHITHRKPRPRSGLLSVRLDFMRTSPPHRTAMSTMDPTLHAGTQLRTIPYLAQQSFAIRYSRYAHDDFFARSVWPSTNHSLLGSKEPTLLCNHSKIPYVRRLSRFRVGRPKDRRRRHLVQGGGQSTSLRSEVMHSATPRMVPKDPNLPLMDLGSAVPRAIITQLSRHRNESVASPSSLGEACCLD
jgi:hypothetical protein